MTCPSQIPIQVSYHDFWARHFFHLQQLEVSRIPPDHHSCCSLPPCAPSLIPRTRLLSSTEAGVRALTRLHVVVSLTTPQTHCRAGAFICAAFPSTHACIPGVSGNSACLLGSYPRVYLVLPDSSTQHGGGCALMHFLGGLSQEKERRRLALVERIQEPDEEELSFEDWVRLAASLTHRIDPKKTSPPA